MGSCEKLQRGVLTGTLDVTNLFKQSQAYDEMHQGPARLPLGHYTFLSPEILFFVSGSVKRRFKPFFS